MDTTETRLQTRRAHKDRSFGLHYGIAATACADPLCSPARKELPPNRAQRRAKKR